MSVSAMLKELGTSVQATFAASSFGCNTFVYGIETMDWETVPPAELPRVEVLSVSQSIERVSICTTHWAAQVKINGRKVTPRPSGSWTDKARDNDFTGLIWTGVKDWLSKMATGDYDVDADIDGDTLEIQLFNTDTTFGFSAEFTVRIQESR